ncbi:MAG: SCO family protein [Candidatus Solibacter usitatus]|nr:SCO family protein [Candidatus Solibacter usitatus]
MSRAFLLSLAFLSACARPSPPLEIFGTVPGFQLTSHKNASFDSALELKGRVWVANFIFTNCTGPCPRMSSQMRQVQDAAKDLTGLRLVSITVDPVRDTPQVLAEYAKRQHAGDRWLFLTGEQADLHHLKRNVFLLGNVDGQLNHSTRFVLVDRQARIRGYYDTSEPDSIARILSDIRRLEKET